MLNPWFAGAVTSRSSSAANYAAFSIVRAAEKQGVPKGAMRAPRIAAS